MIAVSRPLARYEKRGDGFIYPIRTVGSSGYVSYGDAANIVSARAGRHETIEEMRSLSVLVEGGWCEWASCGGWPARRAAAMLAMLRHCRMSWWDSAGLPTPSPKHPPFLWTVGHRPGGRPPRRPLITGNAGRRTVGKCLRAPGRPGHRPGVMAA
ncbi:MAG: hypothetical protein V7603_4492 [Micromonosporaceae bacterium]